ncbi:YdcF family protein [Photobacterium japonica]|uniref:YdcF family protein n=1 Tax=Photobacterium japonica TaxID=2910235 RepID=UPI003D0E9599
MESLFLQQALNAYNSINRRHYPLYGQSVTNLDAVNFYLKQALTLASSSRRTDILITLANMATFQGNLPAAFALYHQAKTHANSQQLEDILCYQVMWHNIAALDSNISFDTSLHATKDARLTLQAHAPQRANALARVIDTVITTLGAPTPIPSLSDIAPSTHHAFVILGHKLNPDGSLSDLLTARLKAVLALKQQTPNSAIIVTGGVQQAGVTEAEQMCDWLTHRLPPRAIAGTLILMDTLAANTLENTHNSLAIATDHGITHLTLVTHANHLHRSLILFNSMQGTHAASPITINATSVENIQGEREAGSILPSPIGQQRINCVIDALRGFGLSAFRASPWVQQ